MQKTKFFSRRAIGTALLAIAAGPALCLSAAAQSWPTKPIKIVVNFPPGGAADQIASRLGIPPEKANSALAAAVPTTRWASWVAADANFKNLSWCYGNAWVLNSCGVATLA